MAYRETVIVANVQEAEKRVASFLDRYEGPAEPSGSFKPVKPDEPEGPQEVTLRHWGTN